MSDITEETLTPEYFQGMCDMFNLMLSHWVPLEQRGKVQRTEFNDMFRHSKDLLRTYYKWLKEHDKLPSDLSWRIVHLCEHNEYVLPGY